MEKNQEQYMFELDEEERLFIKETGAFVEKFIKPISDSVRHENSFPANVDSPLRRAFWQAVKVLRDAGYTNLGIPEKYGGFECSSKLQSIFTEEICRIDGAIGLSVGATLSLVAHPVSIFGAEEQKKTWLQKLGSGAILGCYCQTENEAGSDVKNIKTRAWQDSSYQWRISGNKIFVTNGSEASLALVIARSSPELYAGLSAFLVDLEEEKKHGRAVIVRNETKGGLYLSPTTEILFDGAKAEILGGPESLGRGWNIAMTTLVSSRATAIAGQGVGIARGAFETIGDYANSREVFSKKISNFPVNAEMLARIKTMIEMARLLTYRACFMKDTLRPENYKLWQAEASIAKRFAGKIAELVPSLAVQLAGGIGYVSDFGLVKYWHDGKVVSIYEGTDQIQELIVAEAMGRRTKPFVPQNKILRLIWALGRPWTVSLAEEEALFTKYLRSETLQDFNKLRKLFVKYFLVAGQRYLPTKEEREHNLYHLIWHKLAWALCLLEGAKMLLWKNSYLADRKNRDEEIVALFLVEEVLESVRQTLDRPNYEESVLKLAGGA